ncbi:hypothetical protein ACFLWA_12685 [Chloroflexota bacterium]
MQRVFQQSYHIPGTLTADLNIRFTAPFDMQLIHVSAVASNDSDALLTVGDSDDADEYVVSAVIGDSAVPVETEADTFVDTAGATHGRHYPRIADGKVVVIALDYDGDGGTAADDVTIVLTFTEG